MNMSLPFIDDAIAFLNALVGNVYTFLGFFSTMLTFVPLSWTKRIRGRLGCWLSSKPENKRLGLFVISMCLMFWASFQAFCDERTKLKQAQSQLGTLQDLIGGEQKHQINLTNELSSFSNKCLDLEFAKITKDQYYLWEEREKNFVQQIESWASVNLEAKLKDRLFDITAFTNYSPLVQNLASGQMEKLL